MRAADVEHAHGRRRSALERRSPVRRRSWRGWPAALTDPRVRDTLYALAVGGTRAPAESLWALLARTLPEPWRVEALVLLAFRPMPAATARWPGCRWRRRCGAIPTTGWPACWIRRCSRGCGPEQIRELALTGYRLAKQLGVRAAAAARSVRAETGRSDLLDLDGVRHVVRQLDLLVAGDHDHDAAVRR